MSGRGGQRLEHANLHGAVVHVLMEANKLYVGTELGDHRIWDLSVFSETYCGLLNQVWKAVPVTWTGGRAIMTAAPEKHECRK